jgi:hypothetical protein
MKQNESDTYDIVVVGGTPAGIMAAVAAGRLGSRVMLTEYHGHIGGMSTSGLGKSDIENKEAIAGLFKEFSQRILNHYIDKYGENSENVKLCKEGYYYEPSVAEEVFNQMIQEVKTITLLLNHQIESVEMQSNRITGALFKNRINGEEKILKAGVYVDATYEGDLYALAGAEYRLGREGKDDFNEEHAGRIFFDYNENVFLEGSTGEADKKLTAYTYRLCLSDNPDNFYRMTEPPAGYDREHYVKYFQDLNAGRLGPPKVFKEGHGYYPEHFNTMLRVFSFARIPNHKFDVNINPRPLGFPFVEKNYTYPEADWNEREKIFQQHRALTLGLLYFVQNDKAVPEEHRRMAMKYHLAMDEFTDNQHFPWQLYVREARRLKGQYTLTENDVKIRGNSKRSLVFHDSIISGEFPIDSFPVSSEPSSDKKVLEGYIGMLEINPYQVPYRIMVPEKIEGLIVPVAASTTHVAYSTIRMEPLWMGIGQAAGTAAHLALKMQADIKNVPIHYLQKLLLENRQIITFFEDIETDDKAFEAVQFWGTKGFFASYHTQVDDLLESGDLNDWLNIFSILSGSRVEYVTRNGSLVSVSEFIAILYEIGKNNNLLKADVPFETSLLENSLGPDKWMYNTRENTLPVLRGEACLALYLLFFKLLEKAH